MLLHRFQIGELRSSNSEDDGEQFWYFVPVYGENLPTDLHSLHWHSKTRCRITMPFGSLPAMLILLHVV